MAKKRSRDEINAIVDETIGLLIKANNYLSIVKHIVKTYDVSERHAKEYISRARTRIAELFEPELTTEKVLAGIRFNDLYMKLYKKGDYKGCIAAQEALNKLIGVNEPEKKELTGKNGAPLQPPITFISAEALTPEQIEKYLYGDRTNDESF